jgi:hypothetical protein
VLLAARFELFDVPDVEALCVRAARGWTTKTKARLSPEDFESLVTFLVEAVWWMSERYDPELSSSFKAIALGRLSNRATDWFRTHRGRTRWQFSGHTYERERPNSISLDAPAGRDGNPLGETVADGAGDPASRSGPAFGGLLEYDDCERDWDFALLRAAARTATRGRDQRARAA